MRGNYDTPRTPEQLAKLAKIGITSDLKNMDVNSWDKQYERLKAFIEANDRLPKITKNRPDEFRIATWLYNQKKNYKHGKMPDEHIKMLRELGINL